MKALTKLLISIILTLLVLILFKKDPNFKNKFYKQVYEKNISFAYLNNIYNKYLGNIFNINTQPVFNEKLNYTSKEDNPNGSVKLKLSNPLVSNLEEGIVTFVGQKDDFGNVVIIEDINGVETWYGNLENISVSMYDYLEKGNLIGNTNDLYMLFKKDNKILDYENYLS